MNGNISNGGLVLKDNLQLYLADMDRYSGTVKIDLGSGEQERYDGIWWFMNSQAPYIYYSDQLHRHALYRFHTGTRSIEKLRDEPVYGLLIHEEWLYYIHEEDRKLHRCQLDGRKEDSITNEAITSFFIERGRIYYAAASSGIYSCSLNGAGVEKISGQHALHMVMIDRKLAYLDKSNGYLSLLDLSTGESRTYSDMSPLGLNTDGRYLYGSNQLNDRTIDRVDIERNTRIRICGEAADYLHLIEEQLYFWNGMEWRRQSLMGGQAASISALVRG